MIRKLLHNPTLNRDDNGYGEVMDDGYGTVRRADVRRLQERRLQTRTVSRLTVVAPAPLPRDASAAAAALISTLNERRETVQRTLQELHAELARVEAAIATLRAAAAHYDHVARAERLLDQQGAAAHEPYGVRA